jgi:hypothetical protein
MRLRVIAILALLLVSLILMSAAQSTDYTGKAKVVLKLTKMPEMPAMPQNAATGSAETFGLSADAVAMPNAPQGTMVQCEVLYSGDPSVKAGQAYTLYINYDPKNNPIGFQAGLIDKLKSGTVIGINDYTLDGNMITVTVGTTSDWGKKISILDISGTDPDEQKNPFLIDLGGFRQFSAFPAFNTTTTRPMMNTSGFSWNNSIFGGPSGTTQFSGIFDMIGHLFD